MTIVNGSKVMQAVLYTGTGATQTINCGFQPDLVWIKSRSAATDNKLTDSVRGATKALISNSTGAETTDSTGITAFTSTGFTLGSSSVYNNSGATYVAWCWNAGSGTSSSNTAGSITSTVSVNASAGFSVVTYTGTGANATVGHGLGVAPSMIIFKDRANVRDWVVYHVSLGNTNYLRLNQTDASAALSTIFNNTSPTSSVFSLGSSSLSNQSGAAFVAYCWSEIAGFSKFGSYTGNGSADGTFVYTGFKPSFILRKGTVGAGINWSIIDSSRNTYNLANANLFPNLSNAESVPSGEVDITSNGFKVRSTSFNNSGETYIYMAFAENPTKYSLAR